jgi:cellulose 1,4-beta-cellobiosidase
VATAGDGRVTLSWTASVGATSYRVKRATVSGGPYTTVASPTTRSYINTGLTNGTTYYYVVSAVNTTGESPDSSQVSAMPQPIPPTPTGVTATPGNARVTLAWNASSTATAYRVKRATVSGGPYTTITTVAALSYANTGLTNGTTYYYVVSAINSSGESANSTEVSGTPSLSIPPAPTGLVATPGNGQVSLTWSASSGAINYRVKRSTVSGGPYTAVVTTSATSYTNAGLTNGVTYYFVVSALNTAGESPNSSEVSAKPTPP